MFKGILERSGRVLMISLITGLFLANTLSVSLAGADAVKIGLNYPATGPYAIEGLDQLRAAELAAEEINAAGGILGKQIELVKRDSMSKSDITTKNVTELIDQEGVKMVFGGSSSAVAIAAAKVCQEKGIPFFGTLTYSNETTCEEGHRHTFRECYDAWMGAKAISKYLKENFAGKKYFYITADYTWGWTTETSVRKLSGTEDTSVHKGVKTPFPGATLEHFTKALNIARMIKPDVLVLVLFGRDMSSAIQIATTMGLKKDCQIVVPNLTLGMAEAGGPKVMEGVIGSVPWTWKIPYKHNYQRGKEFVEKFAAKYGRYPSTSGASAYTILYEYKGAAERAKGFDSPGVIKALEGHEYTLLKDKQIWRDFDHQSVQTVYAVRCNPEAVVVEDKYKLDYFEILSSLPGEEAARSREDWNAARQAAGKPTSLERLPGE
ncbi:MAG: substrate-binding protein [Thermodesulfobacteriota bacterium]|nr:substrate-binding protein [Thermodesulfobacteriota bacterium]